MLRRALGPAILTLLLAASPLSAQICAGAPSLQQSRSANLDAGASFYDGGTTYAGGVTFGSSWIGSVAFAYADIDGTGISPKELAGSVAYELTTENGVAICPGVGVGYTWFEVQAVDFTVWTVGPSVSVGYEAPVSETVSVIPTGSARFVYADGEADAGVGGEFGASDSYGIVSGGLGLLFNGVFAITPRVGVPVGLDDGDTTFGVTASVGLGG